MHDCLIAFGSNLGDGKAILKQALDRLLATSGIESLKSGVPLETVPIGGPAGQSKFVNAAIRLQTILPATSLHQRLIQIEQELGRVRSQRWGARSIDLDLLLFDDLILETPSLVVPHPRMSYRRFVLEPARKIAGEMRHPISQLTVNELIQHLDQTSRLILWVTPRSPEVLGYHRRLLANEVLSDWTLKLVDQFEEYQSLRDQAKLLVSSRDLFWRWPESCFRGPLLRLASEDSDPEREIIAAAMAMEPGPKENANSCLQQERTSN